MSNFIGYILVGSKRWKCHCICFLFKKAQRSKYHGWHFVRQKNCKVKHNIDFIEKTAKRSPF